MHRAWHFGQECHYRSGLTDVDTDDELEHDQQDHEAYRGSDDESETPSEHDSDTDSETPSDHEVTITPLTIQDLADHPGRRRRLGR